MKKQHGKDYLTSLAIAFACSSCSSVFAPGPWAFRGAIALISGLVFGNLFFIVAAVVPRLHLRSFLLNAMARGLVTTGTMLAGLCAVIPIAFTIEDPNHTAPWLPVVWRSIFQHISVAQVTTWVLIGLGMSILVNAIHQINRKLGPGVMVRWITGKYYSPREEERIFMFVDLKNSTPLGEKLGDLKFSRLIRDFFHDLSEPILQTRGEVSHYIGDEVVITWTLKDGLSRCNCVRGFFLMREAIAASSAKYLEEYGFVPDFKAGAHTGTVIVTEVGDIKSEIVYHGDVLNTTSRIIGQCAELRSDLLISGELSAKLQLPEALYIHSHGMHLLKGKEHEVEIIEVRRRLPETDASEGQAAHELESICKDY